VKPPDSALAALGDQTRRTILEHLRKKPMAVGQIAKKLPVSRPAVSQHLRILKDAGLVAEERQGTRRIYNVELKGIVELRRYLDGFWDDVLAQLRSDAGDAGKD
jgi:DNA-binding transcriptional ArsR family regulator